MEAIKVAPGFLEVLYPFLRLSSELTLASQFRGVIYVGRGSVHCAYLSDHHVAVKSTVAIGRFWLFDMWTYLCYDGGSKCNVWHKVSVHYYHTMSVS